MESNMKTWNKIAIFISIISGLATLVTIIPIWLSLYFGQGFLYQAIQLVSVTNYCAKKRI
jgi:hypothetical protein